MTKVLFCPFSCSDDSCPFRRQSQKSPSWSPQMYEGGSASVAAGPLEDPGHYGHFPRWVQELTVGMIGVEIGLGAIACVHHILNG